MVIYLFDGSFEGLLTTIFQIYSTKKEPEEIIPQQKYIEGRLSKTTIVVTNKVLSKRVEAGIKKKITKEFYVKLFKVFFSEQHGANLLLLKVIRKIFQTDKNIEEDFSNADILSVAKIVKQFDREIHRMHAFVRFKKAHNDIYYSIISPDFNVLSFLADHFEKRFADQQWIIFDEKRKRGLIYDKQKVAMFEYDPQEREQGMDTFISTLSDTEELYQSLWKGYFHAANIVERKNIKLHLRHMPRRYWKYLVEKN